MTATVVAPESPTPARDPAPFAPVHPSKAATPAHTPARSPRESDLLRKYQRDGDLAARTELAESFMPLARDLALRYRYTDEPVEDLTQVAYLGLLKAIDRFDAGRGTRFTSYAVPTILGELKRHFRDKGWAVRVPRDMQERVMAVNRESEALSKRLGRSPSVRELAERLELSPEAVLEAREAANSYETASLDAPVAGTDADDAPSVADTIGVEDGGYELIESREAIAGAWRALPERERRALRLRFVNDLTQREIGSQIGVSQMHVSRLLRRALERLRVAAEASG
jgi:RNA polymerase sigma-B factor